MVLCRVRAVGKEKVLLELEAEGYQFYISRHFALVGAEHGRKMVAVSNQRRRQLR